MCKHCRVNSAHSCEIWIDYQIALNSLQEAEELAHQNWMEILSLQDRVCQLEAFIHSLGLDIPDEQ